MKKTVFVVEDEADIAGLMKFNLEAAGYIVKRFDRAEPALLHAMTTPPSLFLLDIMLPGVDGIELCKRVRDIESLSRIPIIFVTAKITEEDRLRGFDVGADDYVTKPFSPRELVARVDAILRRSKDLSGIEVIRFGRVEIDCAAMVLRVDGQEIPTTTLEFRLLEYLARSPGLVFSRDRLLEAVWGNTKFVSRRSVDVYVSKLREKIENDANNPEYLVTVRGAGYKMMLPRGGSSSLNYSIA
ncbi:MAG TPA: response regulator transcription factor [Terriglobales bacterium]|nr:response regulator transcription factor [Terriglobales bacterium]